MTGMTLIVDRVRIIYEKPFFDQMLDALVHHGARDTGREEGLFDWLLTKAILISRFVGHSNIIGDREMTSFL